MKIAIASDHGGFELKQKLQSAYAAEWTDFGCTGKESCDYPDFAVAVAEAVAKGDVDMGVLVCTNGMGMSVAANRFHNVRAALCRSVADAKQARTHVGANILCLGAVNQDDAVATEILKTFLETALSDEERHARRRAKVERAQRLSDFSGLAKADPEIYAAIKAQVR